MRNKEDELTLDIKIDMGEDVAEQEGRILNFYKAPNIDLARSSTTGSDCFYTVNPNALTQLKNSLEIVSTQKF